MGATGIYWVERLKILPSILQWTGQPHPPSPQRTIWFHKSIVSRMRYPVLKGRRAWRFEGWEKQNVWETSTAESSHIESRGLTSTKFRDFGDLKIRWSIFFYWICYFRIRQPITLLVKIGVFFGCLKLMTLLSKWLFHFLCVCMHMKRRATQCKHMDHLEGGSG